MDRLIEWEAVRPTATILEKSLMKRVDGCTNSDASDRNDWIKDCQVQKQVYWAINEILVLLKMIP